MTALKIRFAKDVTLPAHERGEIVDLVGWLLDDIREQIEDLGSDTVILETLGGGRSPSRVLKATLMAGADPRRPGAAVAVKISPRDDGMREWENYNQFALPFLPAAHRPMLLAFVAARDRAALCYAFVGRGDRPDTLTARLAAGDVAALDVVLSTVFEGLRAGWYSPSLVKMEIGLGHYYLKRYFGDRTTADEAEGTLLGHASRYFNVRSRKGAPMIGETAFPSVCEVVFSGQNDGAYRSCILHGDLNSDNVILDPDGVSARLVDFQRTGRGHIYQDFVSLEASIRINHPSRDTYGEIPEIERRIALGEPLISANNYAAAIGGVREAARRTFGLGGDALAYQCAVAAVGLRLMKATDLSNTARARICASALWAAKALTKI